MLGFKEGVERSHRADMVSREVGHMGKAVRNKPNQLLTVLKLQIRFLGFIMSKNQEGLPYESSNRKKISKPCQHSWVF